MNPPWVEIPDIPWGSVGWRMGYAEDTADGRPSTPLAYNDSTNGAGVGRTGVGDFGGPGDTPGPSQSRPQLETTLGEL